MKDGPNTITIDDVEYVRKDAAYEPAAKLDGLAYVIVRSESAGVFAGYLEQRDGGEAILREARRIWYWAGAASLSQLASSGTSKPEECKFPCAVRSITVMGVIEVIPCTEQARTSIAAVTVWQV